MGAASASLLGLDACAPSSLSVLTVFAAASLTDAFEALATEWRMRTGEEVHLSFGASGAVARQIEAGAPADIVALADGVWMDRLEKAGRLRTGSRTNFLANRLVVVGGDKAVVGPDPLGALLRGKGRLAIGDPQSVPAGAYAQTWLTSIGVWETIQPRLVMASDVRGVRSFVARGEAELGIVYRSDTVGAAHVRVVYAPEPADQPEILYPIALTADAAPGARRLLDFFRSQDARSTFRTFGFEPVASWANSPSAG